MSNERYEKLFSADRNLYSEGSPIVISAGALLKDKLDDSIVAQIKFMNIVNKRIKSVKIQLVVYDSVGRKLEEIIDFEYLDLCESRDVEFGQKTPIRIPNNRARRFTIGIEEVCFDDDTVWHESDGEWTPIGQQDKIDSIFSNNDIKEQYLIEHGDKSIYQIKSYKDIWMCACGAINRLDEKECHRCGKTKEYFEIRDFDVLKANAEKRLENERKTQKAQKRRMLIAIVAVVTVVVLGLVGKYTYDNVIVSNVIYSGAKKMYENQEYEKAKEEFLSLGEYKDAKSWSEECDTQIREIENKKKYDSATEKLNAGNYEGAIKEFEVLGDYCDSKEKLKTAKQMKYDAAMVEFEKSDYDSKKRANKMFEELADYADSKEFAIRSEEDMNLLIFCNTKHDYGVLVDVKIDAANFFIRNLNNGRYKKLTGSDISKGIIGTWSKHYIDGSSSSMYTFREDGTIAEERFLDWKTWQVKGDKLKFSYSYWVYEVNDTVWILLDDDTYEFKYLFVRK